MKKIISRKGHGFIEAAYIPAVAFAPELFGFEDEETAKLISRIQAGTAFVSGMFTCAEWGLFKIIPFKTHLTADLGLGVFSLVAPWLFGFSKNKKARNVFVAMGVLAIAVSLLTEDENMVLPK